MILAGLINIFDYLGPSLEKKRERVKSIGVKVGRAKRSTYTEDAN